MPSQRPYFLSSFIAAFRQAPPPNSNQQQQNGGGKQQQQHTNTNTAASNNSASSSAHQSASSPSTSPGPTSSAIAAAAVNHHHHHHRHGVTLHSPANHGHSSPSNTVGIPIPGAGGRRRGSDSSSEGFRDAIGADKWYIGGRTATGEEKFFKLGVVRRVRSNDGLSLDRLSL